VRCAASRAALAAALAVLAGAAMPGGQGPAHGQEPASPPAEAAPAAPEAAPPTEAQPDGAAPEGGALETVRRVLSGGSAQPPAAAEGAATEPAAAEPPAEAEPAGPGASLPDFEGDPTSRQAWRDYGEALLAAFVEFIPNLLRALVVLLAFWILYRVLTGVFRSLVRRTRADPSILGIGTRLTKYVLIAFGLVMAISQLGFEVGSVLAGISILGLALGLAAQESLSNVIAGLTLLWDRPFRVGDNVTIAGTFGQVKEMGLRTTRILTQERLDAILPNKEIINQEIINHTLNPQLRLPVRVSIAYKEDTREARRVLLRAVEGHRLILDEPGPAMVVLALGESGVDLELRVWLRDPHSEREALFEITELAKIALDEAGIEIPFPQRTLHFAGRRPRAARLPDASSDTPE